MATDWFDGRIARRRGRTSPLGSLLDPIADKVLVLSVLVVLVGEGVFPGWMVAAIVAREFLVQGLRLAAIERGVVMRGARPREAEDVVASGRGRGRRTGTGGRLERRCGLVGAPRRSGADVDLGPRLRAPRAAAPPRQGGGVVEPGLPPAAAVGRRR